MQMPRHSAWPQCPPKSRVEGEGRRAGWLAGRWQRPAKQKKGPSVRPQHEAPGPPSPGFLLVIWGNWDFFFFLSRLHAQCGTLCGA